MLWAVSGDGAGHTAERRSRACEGCAAAKFLDPLLQPGTPHRHGFCVGGVANTRSGKPSARQRHVRPGPGARWVPGRAQTRGGPAHTCWDVSGIHPDSPAPGRGLRSAHPAGAVWAMHRPQLPSHTRVLEHQPAPCSRPPLQGAPPAPPALSATRGTDTSITAGCLPGSAEPLSPPLPVTWGSRVCLSSLWLP